MTLVVDVSVVLAWCFADESSPLAESAISRVLEEGGIAPAHWPLELANGLRSAERRRRVDKDDLTRLRARLQGLTVEVVPLDLATALAVIDLARDHDLTAYDAAYLDLARSRAMPLATMDVRLAGACRALGVELAA